MGAYRRCELCQGYLVLLCKVPASEIRGDEEDVAYILPQGAADILVCRKCGHLELWVGGQHVDAAAVDPGNIPAPQPPPEAV